MKTISVESIDSTNTYLKNLKKPKEDTLIIAKKQTGGRGTKGRSFICEEGGVYLSLLKLYPCKAKDSFSIMMNSAVAVVKTLSAFDISGRIWLCFLTAVPVSFILFLVFACVYKNPLFEFICISGIIWTTLLNLHLYLINVTPISAYLYLIGIPVQIAFTLTYGYLYIPKIKFRKKKNEA